jgi:MoaA/NifB/PqqE/SkfB family radical SAM enzyme
MMMSYEDQPDPPFSVQIELVEGCNLQCAFCGINAIQDPKHRAYKFMALGTLESVLDDIKYAGWNPRIEFAMHGEPTMHPDWTEAIRMAREILPKASLMMTSNGGGIIKDTVPLLSKAFDAGLNIFALDDYESVNIGKKVRANLDKDSIFIDFDVREYPEDKTASPHTRRPIRTRMLVFVQDISVAKTGTHSQLNNHAGSAGPLDFSKANVRCAKPFRELAVRHDGSIAICCNDWLGIYQCGNVNEKPLAEIWCGNAFKTARRFLYNGMRELPPCHGCNVPSYRCGFLPDQRGREELPVPTSKDRKHWQSFIANDPLTPKVR